MLNILNGTATFGEPRTNTQNDSRIMPLYSSPWFPPVLGY